MILWTCCYELVMYTISPKTRGLVELSVRDEGDGHDWHALLWARRERMKYGWPAWSFCLVTGDVSLSTPQSSVCAGWSPRGLQWIRTTDEVWTVSERAVEEAKALQLIFPPLSASNFQAAERNNLKIYLHFCKILHFLFPSPQAVCQKTAWA